MRSQRTGRGARARAHARRAVGVAVFLASFTPFARGMDLGSPDLFYVQAAALDQPQINAAIFVVPSNTPQLASVSTFDWDSFTNTGVGQVYNVAAYLDTGASGILLSTPTANSFTIPNSHVTYYDVGVGSGSGTVNADAFAVSVDVKMAIANYYQTQTNVDVFDAQNQPVLNGYNLIQNGNTVRLQIGPQAHTIQDPNTQDPSIDQLGQQISDLNDLLNGITGGTGIDPGLADIYQLIADLNAVDVIGMPAMKGKVVVIDPTRTAAVGDFANNIDQLDVLPDMFVHTYVYNPNTPFHPATKDTDPGIPQTGHHIKLSFADVGRFTRISTTDATDARGPTLEHNPFIGQNPVALLFPNDPNNPATPGVPGIKVTRKEGNVVLTSEGNWLLDTGAAASMISTVQAAKLHVFYKAGTFGVDGVTPDLVDELNNDIPNQFTMQIQGIGGVVTLAGFELDSLLLRDMAGDPNNDNDPHHLRFLQAPVLVYDVLLTDSSTGQTLILDGVFGMNFLMGSTPLDQAGGADLTDLAASLSPFPSFFDWVTFDEPNGILGLNLDPNVIADTSVPEPASLAALAVGAGMLLLRRRR